MYFLTEKVCIWIEISLLLIPKALDSKSWLIQIMAYSVLLGKPLSESMLTNIYVTMWRH